MVKNKVSPINRRNFLSNTLAGTGMVSLTGGALMAKRVKASPSTSDKLNIAGIGVGGRGGANLNDLAGENIVALCDVDMNRAAESFRKFPNAKRFQDFRRMFDAMDSQIDAVMIATPDHVHSVAAIHAMMRGKHVYCEKPMAHSIYEVREMMRVARENKVITQLGNQGHSFATMRVFKDWINEGAIGTVREVHAMCGSNYSRIDQLTEIKRAHPIPEHLNWDLWLGPAGMRPFHPAYLPGTWRGWSAFGTGVIGDWTCHIVDPVFWTLNLGAPTTIFAETGDYDPTKHFETFPSAARVHYEFPALGNRPAVRLIWHDGTSRPAKPVELERDETLPNIGALVVGDKGKIVYGSHGAGRPRILDENVMEQAAKNLKKHPARPNHHQEWIAACKTGMQAGSFFEYGGPLTEIALLGVIAIQCKGERLQWDAPRMQFLNSERANRLLKPVFREGWTL